MQQTPRLCRVLAAVAVVAALWPVCTSAQLGGELRAREAEPAVVGDAAPAAPLPEGPNYEKYADGLYVRRVFQTVNPTEEYSVEVWALLIGPGKKTAEVTFPGAATLLVRSGRAAITTGDAKRELGLGASLLVPEGQKVSIVNLDAERPISIRAVIMTGLQ